MAFTAFLVFTAFLFLAIVGGIIGIMLEGRRLPPGEVRNPATRDALWPILGWAAFFVIHLSVEYVGAENLTAEFRMQLGTLVVLPFFYAMLATGWLIWRSARRIVARVTRNEPVMWRTIPVLGRLAFPLMFASAIVSAGTEFARAGFSLSFYLLASVAVLFALLHRPATASGA